MSVVTKAAKAPIGIIAFLGMLFLSPLRGLLIIVSETIKRIIPAKIKGWATPLAWIITISLIIFESYAKKHEFFASKTFIIITGLLTLIGMAATIKEALGSVCCWGRKTDDRMGTDSSCPRG